MTFKELLETLERMRNENPDVMSAKVTFCDNTPAEHMILYSNFTIEKENNGTPYILLDERSEE